MTRDIYARVMGVTQYGRGPHIVALEGHEEHVRTWDNPPERGQVVKLRLRDEDYGGLPQAWIVRGRLAVPGDPVPDLDPRSIRPGCPDDYRETPLDEAMPYGCVCGDTTCRTTCDAAEATAAEFGMDWYVRSLRTGHELLAASIDHIAAAIASDAATYADGED